jgi:hypothetical protein
MSSSITARHNPQISHIFTIFYLIVLTLLCELTLNQRVNCLAFSIASSNVALLLKSRVPINPFSTKPQPSSLNLVPSQGNQLVAASVSAYGNLQNDTDDDGGFLSTTNSIMTAPLSRQIGIGGGPADLVSRMFSGAKFLRSGHNRQVDKLDDRNCEPSRNTDTQYFPIVGFVFVKDGPNHSRPLPTMCNVSCQLHYHSIYEEDLYGWFSPVPTLMP